MATDIQSITFYFDPACPWTWVTSRWLVDIAGAHSLPVAYRPCELSGGKPLEAIPEQYRAGAVASRGFLRAVQAAAVAGRDDVVADWYTAYGTAVHGDKKGPSIDLVRSTLLGAGGEALVGALEDAALDPAVAASRADAQAWAGDDTGSPVTVLHWAEGRRGFFGPVMAPKPTGDDAEAVWAALVYAVAAPQLFELKARRTTNP